MADFVAKCPLCCNKTFPSKTSLVEHLANVLTQLLCPLCSNKLSSIAELIEHLNLDNCQPETFTSPQYNVQLNENNENQIENITEFKQLEDDHNGELTTDLINDQIQDDNENKMYVEILSKQMMKPCLQTQELKFVQEDGESRYVIMEQSDTQLTTASAVLTKQNNDGTISLTTVKDFRLETETLIAPETKTEDSQEEIYSCNTCGVSFSSVLEHIQNYHNDQEVVVEEPIDDANDSMLPLQNTLVNEEFVVTEKLPAPRRVITDTGDIVEDPLLLQDMVPTQPEPLKENIGKQTRAPRRFVQIEKFCDSIVRDIKPQDEKGGPYHKVVVEEVGKVLKMYHCISCNVYVSSLAEFKSHPCKTLKYSCPHCPVTYENSKSFCAHMKVHKGQIDVKKEPAAYECEICCTPFHTNKSLKLHKRMHDPIKSRPIEAPVKSEDGTESNNGRYLCNVCNKMIPVEYKTIHQTSHKQSNTMNCKICNKKFHSVEYLEMHMRVHTIEKVPVSKSDSSLPYACLYCARRFGKPHEKVKHERIHTGEKPHVCEICGKSFRVSYCLTLHMRTHTGARPYACEHCGKRFKAHSVYNHHLLTHSEKRAYKCPYCPKAFKTSVQLAGHKNSHTKPFSCQHCNRPFASMYAVRVHMETHARQNNLKFSCQLCGATYARAFALKDHVKHVHQKDMDATDNITETTTIPSDWQILSTNENVESSVVEIQVPNKDILSQGITVMEMNTGELIVP